LGTPESFALIVGLATVLFVSTNVDDIVLLVAFLADRRFRTSEVTAGQLAGMAVLYGASVAASLVSAAVAPEHVAWLGLLPIALGIKELVEQIRGEEDSDDDVPNPASRGSAGAFSRIFTVTAVTVANGGDNLGVYIPVFAVRSVGDVALIGVIFLVLTVALCLAGHWLVNHSAFSAKLRKYAGRSVPFVLIAIGAWILLEPRFG
jgi:cadmium resistance protein CadD (predicted permease)